MAGSVLTRQTRPPARPDPVRRRHALRRPARSREAAAVGLVAVALTVATNRRVLSGLTTTVGGDLGDPLNLAWQMAWVRHALFTAPGRLWTTPAFLQMRDNLAFTDTALGYTPLGLFLPDGQPGALALLNLAGLAATATALVGGYVLARAMGAGLLAGTVAGLGFGFAPWRLTQTTHVTIDSTGGIALSLAFLARGSGWSLREGWQPERMSWRWIAVGWAVACYQLTFGWAIGVWFVYCLAVPMLLWAGGWLLRGRRRARLPRAVLLAHGLGSLAFVATCETLVWPYELVVAAHPEARRDEGWLHMLSPPWKGLLTAPSNDWFWGQRQKGWRDSLGWAAEMAMSPGFVLLGLAVIGTVFSIWPLRRRIGLVVTTAALVVLSMGTTFPLGHGEWTFLPLYRHLPGWEALRTPGRMMIWVTLGLCLLAAGAVARLVACAVRLLRAPARLPGGARVVPVPPLVLLAVVPAVCAGIVTEGLNITERHVVRPSPVRMSSLRAPILMLPTDALGDYHMQLWGTDGWPILANGFGGFDPAPQTRMRDGVKSFPDAASVRLVRSLGIRTVVVVRSRAQGTPWADAADRAGTEQLGLTRTDLGDAVVYDVP